MSFAFDTNIFVYAADAEAGTRHVTASELIGRALRSGRAVLILQTLAEFYSVVTRKRLANPEDARAFLRELRRALPVQAAVDEDLERAMEMTKRHGMAFWDAMLWATARRAGVRFLLSEDFQDGRTLGGVTFVNPFDQQNRRLVERELPSVEPSTPRT